jgi:hypothetical protein
MTNFEFFLEKCKEAKHFFCQIVLKDNTFILLENDYLPILRSVNESEMIVFIGMWHDTLKKHNYFISLDSVLQDKPPYGLHTVYVWMDHHHNKMNTFIFKNEMFFMLLKSGVEPEIIDLMNSQLDECYPLKNHKRFFSMKRKYSVAKAEDLQKNHGEYWGNIIGQLSQMPPSDRKLFARLHREIYSGIGDLSSSDVHLWDDVVFDVMKIVRDGGGDEEVDKHLDSFCQGYFGDIFNRLGIVKTLPA